MGTTQTHMCVSVQITGNRIRSNRIVCLKRPGKHPDSEVRRSYLPTHLAVQASAVGLAARLSDTAIFNAVWKPIPPVRWIV